MAACAAVSMAAPTAPLRRPPLAPSPPAPARRRQQQQQQRALAPPLGAGLLGGLYETAIAANAEAVARKEGKDQVGATRGIAPLSAVPLSRLDTKAEACAAVLEKQGCLGVQGVLSPATAADMLAFVEAENTRCQADVEAGRAEFDSRFGGVNCRCAPRWGVARRGAVAVPVLVSVPSLG